jgi:hypothetical protein
MSKNTFPVNGEAMPEAQRVGLTEQEFRRAQSLRTLQRLRKEAQDEIHRLIRFLDVSDEYVMTELEDEAELEDAGDGEYSLGSFDRMINQERSWRQVGEWANCADLERDDADNESSLAAPENHVATSPPGVWAIEGEFKSTSGNQTDWAGGNSDDREDDPGDNPEQDDAESGIGDEDGQREQCGYQVL